MSRCQAASRIGLIATISNNIINYKIIRKRLDGEKINDIIK